MLAQTMFQIQEMVQKANKDRGESKDQLLVTTEGGRVTDGQINRLLLSGTCIQTSTKQTISAEEASVALEYIDHVKELRDQAAELEKESEENRQACSSAKVMCLLLLAVTVLRYPTCRFITCTVQIKMRVGTAAAVRASCQCTQGASATDGEFNAPQPNIRWQ